MTRDDIIRMAQEAGITYELVVSGWGQHWIDIPAQFERFAALVAEHEREACAKVCEQLAKTLADHKAIGAEECAASIRARGQE